MLSLSSGPAVTARGPYPRWSCGGWVAPPQGVGGGVLGQEGGDTVTLARTAGAEPTVGL